MNFTMISYFYTPTYPGYGTRLPLSIAQSIIRKGHRVGVITDLPHNPEGDIIESYRGKPFVLEMCDHAKIVRLYNPPIKHQGIFRRSLIYTFFSAYSLFGSLLLDTPDIILGLFPGWGFLVIPAFILSRFTGAPYILFLSDLWPDVFYDFGIVKSNLFRLILDLVAKVTFKLADHIVVASPSIKLGLMRHGVEKEKITVIEICIDTELFRPFSVKRSDEYNNKFVVMYSGIFGPAYDFKTLINCAKMLESYEDIVFVIRGSGEKEREIRQLLLDNNSKNIQIWGIVENMDEVVSIFNFADIFVVSLVDVEISETSQTGKVFEFLSCAKPVIVSAHGELANLLNKSGAGLVAKPANPQDLAEKIIELYKKRKDLSKIGLKGRHFIKKYHSYDMVTKKMTKICNSLLLRTR